jgi:hypothetical protein
MASSQKSFRTIHIVLNKNEWIHNSAYDVRLDLVLTRDFGLKKYIAEIGGECLYLEKLVNSEENDFNNLQTIDFVENWFLDENGEDLFQCAGVKIGKVFKIHLWSELVFLIRLKASLWEIKQIPHSDILLVGMSTEFSKLLDSIGLKYQELNIKTDSQATPYYFDIHKYMNNALSRKSIKSSLLNFIIKCSMLVKGFRKSKKFLIYVQPYHPTLPLINQILKRSEFQLVTSSAIHSLGGFKNLTKQILLPNKTNNLKFLDEKTFIMNHFREKFSKSIVLRSGVDITEECKNLIDAKVDELLPVALNHVYGIKKFLEKRSVKLAVVVTNLGIQQGVLHEFLKKYEIKVFLIINGMLTSKFGNESKYADHINCYSSSMKNEYFASTPGTVVLGDPRMDFYANVPRKKLDVVSNPSIVVGGSGYNNIDLNSFPAIEFEFLNDVLIAISEVMEEIKPKKITIKVRPNASLDVYKSFAMEFFPGLEISIVQDTSMYEILKDCDLYISISSQTLFEASRMGIPVIYYKIDGENLFPPFDSKSSLVTAESKDELLKILLLIGSNINIFNNFLDLNEMERYIGPLDGYNTQRNLSFIESLIEEKRANE